MSEFLGFTVTGLALGAIYAIAASGLVVTYTTSGIFNFAHGAVAMISSFVYWDLSTGDGFTFFGVTWMPGDLPKPLAILLVLFVFAPLLGLTIERVIMRGLRGTSEITQIVVPIALLLLLQGVAEWAWPSTSAAPRLNSPFFGTDAKKEVFGVFVTAHQLIILCVAIALALSLAVLLYRTRVGVAMRAVVDDRELSALNGGRPDRASQVSWVVGVMLAAVAGILLTSRAGAGVLAIAPLTLLVVNAYAAALFGRLRDLPRTFLGAIVIGLAVTYWGNYLPDIENALDMDLSWLSNVREAIPVIVLFIVLLFLPQDRLRGVTVTRTRENFRVPSVKQSVMWGATLVAIVYLLQNLMAGAAILALSTGLVLAIIALSITLLTGYAGEINLAPLTFAAIGALVSHQFEVGAANGGIDPGLAVFAGILALVFAFIVFPVFGIRGGRLFLSIAGFAAAVLVIMLTLDGQGEIAGYVLAVLITANVGALVALPALRLHGLYMGLASFAFAIFITEMVLKERDTMYFNVPFLGGGEDIEINLGDESFAPPRPRWLGLDQHWRYAILLAVVFSVLGVFLTVLRRSRYGRMLTAMKDSPAACATTGLSLVRLKLSVFTLSSAIAGFGGVLYGAQKQSITADFFVIFASLPLVMLTVVGGTGYISGALLAGVLTGVAFDVMSTTIGDTALGFTAIGGLLLWFGSFVANVGPAGAALSVADQPSGIAHNFIESYEPLRDSKFWPYVGAILGAVGVVYGLAATDVVGNWAFAIVASVAVLAMPNLAVRSRTWLYGVFGFLAALVLIWWNTLASADRPTEGLLIALAVLAIVGITLAGSSAVVVAHDDVALEYVGISRPFTRADRAGFDEELALGDHARKLASARGGRR